MKICREDWERVIDKAWDLVHATEDDGDPMYEVHLEGMLVLLDELAEKYGPQPQILATRADYLEGFSERLALYKQALELAEKSSDLKEIEEIQDSINRLIEEERDAASNDGTTPP